jgi:hypothetical protein
LASYELAVVHLERLTRKRISAVRVADSSVAFVDLHPRATDPSWHAIPRSTQLETKLDKVATSNQDTVQQIARLDRDRYRLASAAEEVSPTSFCRRLPLAFTMCRTRLLGNLAVVSHAVRTQANYELESQQNAARGTLDSVYEVCQTSLAPPTLTVRTARFICMWKVSRSAVRMLRVKSE